MHTNHDKLQLHFPHLWYRFSSAEADSCLCWGLRCLTLPWSLMCHGANADQLRAGQPSFPTQLLVKLKRILFFVFSCSKENQMRLRKTRLQENMTAWPPGWVCSLQKSPVDTVCMLRCLSLPLLGLREWRGAGDRDVHLIGLVWGWRNNKEQGQGGVH